MGLLRKDMSAKPVYDTLKRLIRGRWWSETKLETDADGRAAFRGFLDDYQVRVTQAGKDAVETINPKTKPARHFMPSSFYRRFSVYGDASLRRST